MNHLKQIKRNMQLSADVGIGIVYLPNLQVIYVEVISPFVIPERLTIKAKH